ncbi:uncharacterized protein LOC124354665 [Homalodisca vitripennis]|uniref:uncharacterized protein LOC124354665 n=1 Tax=Homalodisca vitripennis TaxID=197043 RepID=UPI001EE9FA34|nr:uncharacterized protein LOC124354665 [Homalodisca vitripennis]
MVSCCCGCSLSTGAKVIGWFSMFGASLSALIMWGGLETITQLEEHPETSFEFNLDIIESVYTKNYKLKIKATAFNYSVARMFIWTLIGCSLASLLSSVILLIGVYRRKLQYVRLWMILYLLTLLLDCGAKLLIMNFYNRANLVVFLFYPLYLYYVLVVYGHYKELIRDRKNNVLV